MYICYDGDKKCFLFDFVIVCKYIVFFRVIISSIFVSVRINGFGFYNIEFWIRILLVFCCSFFVIFSWIYILWYLFIIRMWEGGEK